MEELFEFPTEHLHTIPNQTELFDIESPQHEEKPNEPSGKTKCFFCNVGLNLDDETIYSEILSFVTGKKKDSSVLRKYTGRYACSPCIRSLRVGVDPRELSALAQVDEPDFSATVEEHSLPTDRSPDYVAGYKYGVVGTYVEIDSTSWSSDFKEGYVAGDAERKAKEWISGSSALGTTFPTNRKV